MVSDTFIKAKSWGGRESTHAAPVSFFREDEDHFSSTLITSASSYSCADGELSCLLYPLRWEGHLEKARVGARMRTHQSNAHPHTTKTHIHIQRPTHACVHSPTHIYTDIHTHFSSHVNTHRQTHMQVTLSLQICQFIVGLGLILLHLCKNI